MAKHLQQHNIWPVSYATLISIAGFLFWGGVFFNQTNELKTSFNEFKAQYKEDRREMQAEIDALRSSSRQAMNVFDKRGNVLGIATHEASLVVTIPPLPVRPVTPVTTTPTP